MSANNQPDYRELQRRRQARLAEMDEEGAQPTTPTQALDKGNGADRSPLPKKGVSQLNLQFLDPLNPQDEYFSSEYPELRDFQGVIANRLDERENLSSLFTAWDSIPKYNGQALAQGDGESRDHSQALEIVTHRFVHGNDEYEMVLTPAQIQEKEKGRKERNAFYYPGISEEYVELQLVKMAMDDAKLFDDPMQDTGRAYGALFSLSGLRTAMSNHGKTRSYAELYRSLQILHKCNLELRVNGQKSASAPILPELYNYHENGFKKTDPSARWAARFHPLISMAINSRSYRQYNIERLLCTNSKASLCLSKHLLTQARNLSETHPCRISYLDFVRHYGELNYSRRNDGIRKFIAVAKSLKKFGTLHSVEVKKICGPRNRVEDVELALYGSSKLISEIKAGHLKERLIMERYQQEKARLEAEERQ